MQARGRDTPLAVLCFRLSLQQSRDFQRKLARGGESHGRERSAPAGWVAPSGQYGRGPCGMAGRTYRPRNAETGAYSPQWPNEPDFHGVPFGLRGRRHDKLRPDNWEFPHRGGRQFLDHGYGHDRH